MAPEAALRLLLVEDNPGDVCLAREALAASAIPAEVVVAADGVSALAILRTRADEGSPVHAVLLDLNLPGWSGFEVLSEIRRDPRLRHLVVVVLSSSSSEADIARAYRGQADCYVTKPADLDEYVAAVRSIQEFSLHARDR